MKKQNHIISVLQQEHKKLINEIITLEGGTHAKKNVNVANAYKFMYKKVNFFFLERQKVDLFTKSRIGGSTYISQ